MADQVEVSVRSALSKVIDELAEIREKATETGEAFKATGDNVGEGLRRNVKQTETFFGQLLGVGRRVADQLRGDFKSMLSINAVTDAMKIGNQFRKNINETVELNDTIRKLGTTFGITQSKFATFQAAITRGLGEIGLGSDVAVSALKGLAETPVRGQQNLIGYSQQAGMLASVSNEKGKEGEIAQGLARVVQARGGDVNDPKQVTALAESLRKVFVQTGQTPTTSLRSMQQVFERMPDDLRKKLSSVALTNITAAGAVGGPNSVKFIEEYLAKSKYKRLPFDSQGGANLVSDKGLDTEKFSKFFHNITSRIPGDKRAGVETLDLSPEAAEGFIRLGENLDKVRQAQEQVGRTTGDLNSQYRSSLGLGEAFAANINQVKKALAGPLAAASQGATGILGGASQSTGGAAAVVGGAGIAATLLGGAGLRGLGKGLGGIAGTVARKEGAEELLGSKTIPVYVVNASEIGGGGALGNLLGGGAAAAGGAEVAGAGGAAALTGPVGLLAGGFAALYALKAAIDDTIEGAGKDLTGQQYSKEDLATLRKAYEGGKIPEGQRANVETILKEQDPGSWQPGAAPDAAERERGGTQGQAFPGRGHDRGDAFPGRPQRVIVELNDPRLKVSVQPTRGATN